MRQYLDANFSPDIQARELANPDVTTFLAEIKGELAGYAQLRLGEAPQCVIGPSPIEIVRLYALSRYHGQGVGAALMRTCLDTAREIGAQTIWLGVWEQNDRAIAFYRKHGFVECGDHIFQLGSDPQRDIIMARTV